MSKINRLPWGLQDILGSVSQGDNPSELLKDVRASFDMWPLWTPERLRFVRTGAVLDAEGEAVSTTIPDGEYWMPITFSMKMVASAAVGTVFSMQMGMGNLPDNQGFALSLSQSDVFTTTSISQSFVHAYSFPYRILLSPGTTIFGTLGEYLPGGALTDVFEVNALFTLLNA